MAKDVILVPVARTNQYLSQPRSHPLLMVCVFGGGDAACLYKGQANDLSGFMPLRYVLRAWPTAEEDWISRDEKQAILLENNPHKT